MIQKCGLGIASNLSPSSISLLLENNKNPLVVNWELQGNRNYHLEICSPCSRQDYRYII